MASLRRSPRKRKSGNSSQVFDVSQHDLGSGSKAEDIDGLPAAKVAKLETSSAKDVQTEAPNLNVVNLDVPAEEPQEIAAPSSSEEIIESTTSHEDTVSSTVDLTIEAEVETSVPNSDSINSEAIFNTSLASTVTVNSTSETTFELSIDESISTSTVAVADPTKDTESLVETCVDSSVVVIDDQEDGEINEDIPIITIKFGYKAVADVLLEPMKNFIKSLDDEIQVKCINETLIVVSGDPASFTNDICLNGQRKSKKHKKKRKFEDQSSDELFVVDSKPTKQDQRELRTKYSTKFLIDGENTEEDVSGQLRPKPALSLCFNCDGEHAIKDCQAPKNPMKIAANRQKFQNKHKSARYHIEEDQKYHNFQPGQLSQELRKALGLRKNQIPGFIYNMRRIGYPPGWLEEARHVNSELEMFDIDGKNVKNTNTVTHGLNPAKVIDYPGFNAPLGKEFKDEYKFYRVPPYSDKCSKEKMIEYFDQLAQNKDDITDVQDMDLDTSDLIVVDSVDEVIECSSVDESLADLQSKKNSLLDEIKKTGEPQPWDDTANSSMIVLEEITEKADDESMEKTQPAIESTVETIEKSDTSLNASTNSVKHTVFGTPILKSSSPYAKLPNPDNFMKGVSPMIEFENLPNSIGKYEQMTGVLQKVRNILKHLQK